MRSHPRVRLAVVRFIWHIIFHIHHVWLQYIRHWLLYLYGSDDAEMIMACEIKARQSRSQRPEFSSDRTIRELRRNRGGWSVELLRTTAKAMIFETWRVYEVWSRPINWSAWRNRTNSIQAIKTHNDAFFLYALKQLPFALSCKSFWWNVKLKWPMSSHRLRGNSIRNANYHSAQICRSDKMHFLRSVCIGRDAGFLSMFTQ